jgi:DNA polymerase, archaea type
METLLDAGYRTEDEKALIDLFYLPENQSEDKKIKEVKDFLPYFYAIPANTAEDLLSELEQANLPQIERTRIVRKKDFHKDLEVVEVSLRHPRYVPEMREKIAAFKNCLETREDDIRFVQRYIIDSGIVPMKGADSAKMRIAAFDIETTPDPKDPTKNLPIMISYADSLGVRAVWNFKYDSKLPFVERLEDEKGMIESFMDAVKKQKIDILVTYNGDNFDFPVISERCKALGIKFALGAKGEEVRLERRGMDMGARIIGRPHVDLYPVCRKMFYLPRYTLEDVHLALFDEEKKDIDIEKMFSRWAENEQVDEIFEYSVSDVDSCLRIAHEVLPTQYELSQLINQPLFEVTRMGTGGAIEWLLMKLAHDKGILVPSKPSDRDYAMRRMDRYEGAYVVEPEKGLHDNILVFDFRSLYPSIIIAHNIDASTINCDCCKGDEHVSPTGAKFCKKIPGLIPELLDDILKSRAKTKLEMKKLVSEKGDKTKIKSLDARQQALKILANSAYGYMGFSRARWYNNDCAASVAAWGREYIKNTIKVAESEGYKVVYGDTDSLMLKVPGKPDENEIRRIKSDFLSKVNSKLPQAMELEFEGFFPRGVFITKKRYALIGRDKKLTIKGLETKRRDWANIAKSTQEKVLYTILQENNPEKAAEMVKAVVQDLRDMKVPLKDLLIYTQITKPLGEYENTGPHVAAARKAIKMGKKIVPGEVIQYVITKKGNSISDKAVMVGFVNENDYDPDYYINNQLLPAVMRILEALGYSEDELKGLGKQMTLGGF